MYRIMIIDDEPLSLSVISDFINSQFNSVTTHNFSNSFQALQAFQEYPFDIVITDIRMPLMDGLKLLEEMQKVNNRFVPIIISGYSEFSYAKQAMQMGVTYYLIKPIDFAELQQAVTAAIRKLRQNQFIRKDYVHADSESRAFFTRLTKLQYANSRAMEEAFFGLHLPFSLSSCSGSILRITTGTHRPTDTAGSPYFSSLCEIIVRMFLHPQYICLLDATSAYTELLLIRPEVSEEAYRLICEQIGTILDIDTEIQLVQTFPSLYVFCGPDALSGSKSEATHTVSTGDFSNPEDYHDCIRLAVSYINEHYAESLTRESVANAVHVSSSYFSTLFKRETGVSFFEYLTEVRINHATLLLNTNMKIQDIAKAVGYTNQGRFLVNFKKHTSYTPSEYRHNILKIMY